MNILFLGIKNSRIIEEIEKLGHSVTVTEDKINIDFIKKYQFDFCISYRYRHILKSDIIDTFKDKIINLHISLLPWNRGADPNFWSFLENTPKGVTIHRIDEGIDTGDILLQEKVDFQNPLSTLASTYEELSQTIENLFINNIQSILSNSIKPKKQPSGGSFHHIKDREKWDYLLQKDGWNTPVKNITALIHN